MNRNALTLVALAAAAGTAAAQPAVLSFTYSDLHSSFDANSGAYTAAAGSMTAGDVTRLDAMPGSAEFDTGSLPGASADVLIAMSISSVTASSAQGSGTLTLTDADGDTITGDIDGQWVLFMGSMFFEGMLSNVLVNDISADDSFDGTTGGSFSTNGLTSSVYEGSIVELMFDPGDFFNSSFSDQTTLASGLVVPAPGAAALAAAGGLLATRRRRNR